MSTFISRYRAISYFRVSDSNGVNTGPFIEIITPDEVLDSYGVNRVNVAYIAGKCLKIKASVKLQYGFIGAYINPAVDPESFSSWIADTVPYAIVFEAARVIFKTIGHDAESAQYNNLVFEQFTAVKGIGVADES